MKRVPRQSAAVVAAGAAGAAADTVDVVVVAAGVEAMAAVAGAAAIAVEIVATAVIAGKQASQFLSSSAPTRSGRCKPPQEVLSGTPVPISKESTLTSTN